MPLPLQNRILPDGTIVAQAFRGTLYGNRGGKIHDSETRSLHPTKRWANKQWICCALSFKGRKRPLMGEGYTEFFFFDEVTALAAGHRPCFECRNASAKAFGEAWRKAEGLDKRPRAADMDKWLHAERLEKREKRLHPVQWGQLPVGSVASMGQNWLAKHAKGALVWDVNGYRTTENPADDENVMAFTPPRIQAVLHHGYAPQWHPSAPPHTHELD